MDLHLYFFLKRLSMPVFIIATNTSVWDDCFQVVVVENGVKTADYVLSAQNISKLYNVPQNACNMALSQWFEKHKEFRWIKPNYNVHTYSNDRQFTQTHQPHQREHGHTSLQQLAHVRHLQCGSSNVGYV